MKLQDCQIGMLVIHEENGIGHIIGLGENTIKEVTLKVKWSNESECYIHPGNVEPLKKCLLI